MQLACGDYSSAERSWRESLLISRDAADYDNAICCIGGLVAAAGSRGDFLRASQLAGAYARLSDEYSYFEKLFWLERLKVCEQERARTLGAKHEKHEVRVGGSTF